MFEDKCYKKIIIRGFMGGTQFYFENHYSFPMGFALTDYMQVADWDLDKIVKKYNWVCEECGKILLDRDELMFIQSLAILGVYQTQELDVGTDIIVKIVPAPSPGKKE